MEARGSSCQNVTEYVVRVLKNTAKRYNIMAFKAADKVNLAWNQAGLERDLSNKIYQEEEMPESGEFNRKLREEALRVEAPWKKYRIVLKEFQAEDQPWLLRVNGKSGRKFKGIVTRCL